MKKAAKTSRAKVTRATASVQPAKRTTARAPKAPAGAATRGADGMRAAYDFSGAVRGKYAKHFAAGSNVVVLEAELAAAFPTTRAVNAALRRQLAASGAKPIGRGRTA